MQAFYIFNLLTVAMFFCVKFSAAASADWCLCHCIKTEAASLHSPTTPQKACDAPTGGPQDPLAGTNRCINAKDCDATGVSV